MSQLKRPRTFETAAPLVVERGCRGGADLAVVLISGQVCRCSSSTLDRVVDTSVFRRRSPVSRIGLSKAPLRCDATTVTGFGSIPSFGVARLLGCAPRRLHQLRTRSPQPSNFRMKRSRWDKVPFDATAAGRLSWC
jgi:hypothetical protein